VLGFINKQIPQVLVIYHVQGDIDEKHGKWNQNAQTHKA
jgi:hypothetical protein